MRPASAFPPENRAVDSVILTSSQRRPKITKRLWWKRVKKWYEQRGLPPPKNRGLCRRSALPMAQARLTTQRPKLVTTSKHKCAIQICFLRRCDFHIMQPTPRYIAFLEAGPLVHIGPKSFALDLITSHRKRTDSNRRLHRRFAENGVRLSIANELFKQF
jgi:hypothetical protein